MSGAIKVGLIGAGYIATWHADAIRACPDAELACICDVSSTAAKGMAEGYGVAAYTSVADMVAAGAVQAVHILTPPNLHHAIALECIAAGLHVIVEKPVALSLAETREIVEAAKEKGVQFAAGHNFLGVPSYGRLKAAVQAGDLGKVSNVEVNWALPMGPLRAGPYNLWLLRDPQNMLLELGAHPYAFACDLLGELEILSAEIGQTITLPGGAVRPQSWRVLARAGAVDVAFNFSLVEVFDDRSVTVRGSTGLARLDYAADTLVIQQENTADLVMNPLFKQLNLSWQHLREGVVNAARQTVSLNQKSPYGLSFRGTVNAIYDSIRHRTPMDARYDGAAAQQVMGALEATLAKVKLPKDPKPKKGTPKPTVMVIGGTGFIGRNLTRELVARGHDVRVLSRGKTGPFDDIADHVETVSVSLSDKAGLVAAMDGIDAVFNLAKSLDKTWEDALKNDVGVAVRVAEACLEAGVKRLIYTGTIASYDMSSPDVKITEDTDFGEMEERNLYARSKAECERRLLEMHEQRGLPVTIARPGIVVGEGGPLQHWGIGRWHGAGAVRIWGQGRHNLPFVLADDVSDALIRMMEQDAAVGQSFNLIGEPMMSAQDYFNAIHQATGAKIRVVPGDLTSFYAADGVKFALKKYVLRKKGLVRPSLSDWKSRAHYAQFDNARPKAVLGWKPESDRARFVEKAISRANLFGI
ncbi:NAD-dependent epimerase/dehydratase family protein [Thalassobius vesicularis]|uniref:NAD-dependent epimerase/dehydratase family protein n=1 Tax=Thalassobius vesicularis TaxID=1294297 RepID=A0A4S3MD45_9RHOB|nr:NAD-dependent epimerase/dehydratase family protein [Thalassobius vesicularis]THD76733.1 NAD-dependent epimerase/dehydratase family protein [Thalassobius vesicularis]